MRAIDTYDSSQIETLQLKGMMNTKQADQQVAEIKKALSKQPTIGVWDEKGKTWLKPGGTVKQGRRPMYAPLNKADVRRLELDEKLQKVEQQRDELLEKLKFALEFPRSLITDEQFKADIRELIVKTEGRAE